MFLSFHALHQRAHAELPGQFHDGFHDVAVRAAVLVQMPQKLQIDLDQVHVELAEHVQRRIAAAEIIKPQSEAVLADLTQLGLEAIRGRRHVLLGDLDDDVFLVDAVPAEDFVQRTDDVGVVKILRREVHRHGNDGHAGLLPLGDLPAELLRHVQIQLVQQVVFLQHGDKLRGADDAAHGIHPARQRLQSGRLAGFYAHDGLVEYLDPPIFQCRIEGFHDVSLAPVAVAGLGRIQQVGEVQIAADLLQRVPRVLQG